MEQVILVDEHDNVIGTSEKMKAHKSGQLHRAISVFIFNSKGELLLQQRAADKYHSSNLWTNTCCSHPRPDEDSLDVANRRLKEEMGLEAELKWLMSFKYRITFDNGLTEHELDHVFVGQTDQLPTINLSEASDYKYINTDELKLDIQQNPDRYTYWFKELIDPVLRNIDLK